MLQRAKGTRDFLPEEKIFRNKIVTFLTTIFEKYGFNPLETPVLERMDVLASKYAGGAEILKETFKLNDQGERELGLRYDLTVPLARVVAMNRGLRMPFKRYAIDRVFRDGPLKTGRYREFWQCDVDVIGVEKEIAEIELLTLTNEFFKTNQLEVVIKINDRRLLDAIVESCGVDKKQTQKVILVLDKLDKVGTEAVKKELSQDLNLNDTTIKQLLDVVLCTGNNKEKLSLVEKRVGKNDGLTAMKNITAALPTLEFSPSLARGLAYYTGPVFEVFLKDQSILASSLAAGGRYDKMIGDFIQDGKIYPAVGISFGLDVLTEALKCLKQQSTLRQTVTDVYIVSIGCFDEAYAVVQECRANNINADIDLLDRGLSKNLEYASKAGIPYVLFIGKQEVAQKKVKLRNMTTGKEQLLSIKECVSALKKNRA